MKAILILSISISLSLVFGQLKGQDNSEFPVLKGAYLGQKPPGRIPEIFAPGIVSTELHEHSIPSFSPDGKQLLWYSQFLDDGGFPSKVIGIKNIDGVWTVPDFFAPISFVNSSSAFFSPDGKRIYFTSKGDNKEKSYGGHDIWYIEKTGTGWTSPENMGLPVNGSAIETYATFTNNKTIYFMREIDPETHKYGIYRSELIDGKYQTPELLPESINTEYLDWTPFIDPDESYLLFSSHRPTGNGDGNGDLYISYKNSDNTWTDPVNLGPTINDPQSQERFPYVSPDGKYLFFASNKLDKELKGKSLQSLKYYKEKMTNPGNSWNDIYWVSTKIIEDLRPKN